MFLKGFLVSIPDRYAKNAGFYSKSTRARWVSIPDRYAKNMADIEFDTTELEFQFLIGTLKTRGWAGVLEVTPKFQFLIGTLKTQLQKPCLQQAHLVSIPDRYAKNGLNPVPLADLDAVFQFLIGTLKTRVSRIGFIRHSLFQFLIGTLKTRPGCRWRRTHIKFQFLIGTLKTSCYFPV